jgi:hypothetical protein
MAAKQRELEDIHAKELVKVQREAETHQFNIKLKEKELGDKED